jgi:hypothetical protein
LISPISKRWNFFTEGYSILENVFKLNPFFDMKVKKPALFSVSIGIVLVEREGEVGKI